MSKDIYLLRSARGKILDKYLAKGWYRTGMFVFTTHTLAPREGAIYPVFWLRYIVSNVVLSAKNNHIIRSNSNFTVGYRPFSVTEELRELHKAYVDSITFSTAGTLENLLTDVTRRIFDTYLIEVRDNGRLIAAGVFDKGTHTIAGIVNIYRPEYKKYSPGKYLMILKYLYCVEHKIPVYYPGYYSTELPVFDYKLFLDKNATQVYLPETNEWVPYFVFAKS